MRPYPGGVNVAERSCFPLRRGLVFVGFAKSSRFWEKGKDSNSVSSPRKTAGARGAECS